MLKLRLRTGILNDYGTLVGELFKVWLQRQVVVEGFDIGGQHLAALCDVDGRVPLCAKVSAHVSSVGAVSGGDKSAEA